jgi:hypothetical protein
VGGVARGASFWPSSGDGRARGAGGGSCGGLSGGLSGWRLLLNFGASDKDFWANQFLLAIMAVDRSHARDRSGESPMGQVQPSVRFEDFQSFPPPNYRGKIPSRSYTGDPGHIRLAATR